MFTSEDCIHILAGKSLLNELQAQDSGQAQSQTLLPECDIFISKANNVLRVFISLSKTRAMDKKYLYRKISLLRNRLDIHIKRFSPTEEKTSQYTYWNIFN